jgi:regulatory protein
LGVTGNPLTPFLAVLKPDLAAHIYRSAIGLLARREHSSNELQQKLLQRFPDAGDAVQTVLTRLIEEGYQSDSRYVEAYTRSRLNKGYGPQRLRQELYLRGVDNQLIEAALSQMNSDGKPLESLLHAWRKKFKALPQDAREKSRQINFLRYRGFSSSEIESLFRYLDEHQT